MYQAQSKKMGSKEEVSIICTLISFVLPLFMLLLLFLASAHSQEFIYTHCFIILGEYTVID